jgi:hypothetical protein
MTRQWSAEGEIEVRGVTRMVEPPLGGLGIVEVGKTGSTHNRRMVRVGAADPAPELKHYNGSGTLTSTSTVTSQTPDWSEPWRFRGRWNRYGLLDEAESAVYAGMVIESGDGGSSYDLASTWTDDRAAIADTIYLGATPNLSDGRLCAYLSGVTLRAREGRLDADAGGYAEP